MVVTTVNVSNPPMMTVVSSTKNVLLQSQDVFRPTDCPPDASKALNVTCIVFLSMTKLRCSEYQRLLDKEDLQARRTSS